MNEDYFCKFCGDSHAALTFLTYSACTKSPDKHHHIYKGTKRGRQVDDEKGRYYRKNYHYYCKYCGHPHVMIAELTGMSCEKSPTGYHQPFEGEDQSLHSCKYCNNSSKTIKALTKGYCSQSPNGYHQPQEWFFSKIKEKVDKKGEYRKKKKTAREKAREREWLAQYMDEDCFYSLP